MVSVALFALFWSIHDFVLPQIGDPAQLALAVQHQLEAFHDWRLIAAVAWTGEICTKFKSVQSIVYFSIIPEHHIIPHYYLNGQILLHLNSTVAFH